MQERTWIAGVVGGRHFTDYKYMVKHLNLWQKQHGRIVKIVSGGASGADSLAEDYSSEYLNKEPQVLRAKWGNGRRAGPIRNKLIVEASQVIIAFPGPESSGTWSTVDIANKKNVPVYIYRYWVNPPEKVRPKVRLKLIPKVRLKLID